ncbi:hypothetical protein PR048_011074 [Dryococelus australis]|uniref:Uncharacterized protein n=1 Tax=Dryococelus australis TaxID=614101 RepID=A0ABQ9HKJ2_9NEOP|nr:hypothetical protein PR048_011074 [Dryococelus australis]
MYIVITARIDKGRIQADIAPAETKERRRKLDDERINKTVTIASRTTLKSAFLQLFSYTTPEGNSTNDPRRIVIDGGHLLHALVWSRPARYGQIADAYLEFVQKHYGVSVTVVFDGNNVQPSKQQEHFRRASKRTFAEIMFDMNTSAGTTQADFLSNHHNKERLITLLSHHFETAGIEVCNSEGDADTLIVKIALELASVRNNVTVVASDTDIVVMLLDRANDDMELRVLSSGTNTKCDKVYNVREIQEKIGESKDSVLFCHAVTGCDTKHLLSLAKVKRKRGKFSRDLRLFNSPHSTKEEVCAAGEKFVIALYGGIRVNNLDELRVSQYTCSITKQPVTAAFELASLPPTSAACAEHSQRTYYQSTLRVEMYAHNIETFNNKNFFPPRFSIGAITYLNPVDWGWKLARGFLVPILTSRAPATESLLRLVFCGCKTDCAYRCECRRAELACSTMCGHYRGGSFMNIKIQDFHRIGRLVARFTPSPIAHRRKFTKIATVVNSYKYRPRAQLKQNHSSPQPAQ